VLSAVSSDLLTYPGAGGARYPFVRRWQSKGNPLPVRAIQAPREKRIAPAGSGPPWHETGPAGQPFDFSAQMRRLLGDIVARTPEFARIDMPRILISAIQARGGRRHGLQARVTPLRFQHGRIIRERRGGADQVQRYFLDGHEFLYLLTFCLPRFLDQDFDNKLVTLFHELQHIDPDFNGDLRRHAGRCQYHSTSRRQFDRHMTALARAYLQSRPDPRLHAFLRLNFAQLRERHGSVMAIVVPRPKLIPISAPHSAAAPHNSHFRSSGTG